MAKHMWGHFLWNRRAYSLSFCGVLLDKTCNIIIRHALYLPVYYSIEQQRIWVCCFVKALYITFKMPNCFHHDWNRTDLFAFSTNDDIWCTCVNNDILKP